MILEITQVTDTISGSVVPLAMFCLQTEWQTVTFESVFALEFGLNLNWEAFCTNKHQLKQLHADQGGFQESSMLEYRLSGMKI